MASGFGHHPRRKAPMKRPSGDAGPVKEFAARHETGQSPYEGGLSRFYGAIVQRDGAHVS
jgi:hypothetical protein